LSNQNGVAVHATRDPDSAGEGGAKREKSPGRVSPPGPFLVRGCHPEVVQGLAGLDHVGCLQPLGTLRDLELDLVPFLADESEPLRVVEPLHTSCSHNYLQKSELSLDPGGTAQIAQIQSIIYAMEADWKHSFVKLFPICYFPT
jgi:hypothetical protein